jgi:hypothetical protein
MTLTAGRCDEHVAVIRAAREFLPLEDNAVGPGRPVRHPIAPATSGQSQRPHQPQTLPVKADGPNVARVVGASIDRERNCQPPRRTEARLAGIQIPRKFKRLAPGFAERAIDAERRLVRQRHANDVHLLEVVIERDESPDGEKAGNSRISSKSMSRSKCVRRISLRPLPSARMT